MTTPVTRLQSLAYSAENELVGVTPSGLEQCTGAVSYGYSLRGELTFSPACPTYSPLSTFLANGVAMRGQLNASAQYTWNDLMAVLTANVNLGGGCGYACNSSWSYDAAGRMTSETEPYGGSPQNQRETSVTRTYDAENHLNQTTLQSGLNRNTWPYEVVSWGPDQHPIAIATWSNGSSLGTERLHWDGDQLLFTTNSSGGSETLDDIKVDVQGDILPGNPSSVGYNGLTFFDRGPGGTIMGCHNATGTTYVGLADSFMGYPVVPCSLNQSPKAQMPSAIVWAGTPYSAGQLTVGTGGTLGMPRTDGFTDGYDTIQGVRSYDPTASVWTTPDFYQGGVGDPASQKSYTWNGNDPMDNGDPTGYFFVHSQPEGWESPFYPPPPTASSCPDGGCLITIATVVAHCHCRTHATTVATTPLCTGHRSGGSSGYPRGSDYTMLRLSGGEIINGTYEIGIDSFGNVYGGAGVSVGWSLLPVSATLSGGYISPLSNQGATAQQVKQFITGWTFTAQAAAGGAAGVTVNPKPPGLASEGGVGLPSASLGASFGSPLGHLPGC